MRKKKTMKRVIYLLRSKSSQYKAWQKLPRIDLITGSVATDLSIEATIFFEQLLISSETCSESNFKMS